MLIVRLGFILGTLLLAVCVPHFDLLMGLTGSLSILNRHNFESWVESLKIDDHSRATNPVEKFRPSSKLD